MMQNTQDKLAFLGNLVPSEDFGLNVFLGKLDESLKADELGKLKFYCEGNHGIGKSALEKVKRPLDLFRILKERGLLSNENLLTLQAMLWFLPRKDLQRQCADFAKSLGNALHFVVPKDEPENGYRYVKFHVEGKNLDTFTRSELEYLRNVVAQTILMIPPVFVIVRGIEPAKSLIITLMVPADYEDQLLQINDEDKLTLLNLSVNTIYVHESKVSLSVETAGKSTKRSTHEEETRRKLYLLEQREKELETRQSENIVLEKKLTESNNFGVSLMAKVFLCAIQNYNLLLLLRPQSRLAYLSALSYFRYALGKMKQNKYDADIVSNLLDAQCLLINERWNKQFGIMERSYKLAFERLCTVNITLQYERDKLAFYHGIGKTDKIMSEREEYFFSLISRTPVPPAIITTEVNIEMTPECLDYVLKNLAKDLTKDEVKQVLQKSNFSKEEKKAVGDSALKLLKKLVEKHRSKRGNLNFNQFLVETLQRPDLWEHVNKYVQEYDIKEQERQFKERSKSSKGGKRSNSFEQTPNANVEAKLEEILQRMNKIDERQQKFEENMYHPSNLHNSFPQTSQFMDNENILSKLLKKQIYTPSHSSRLPQNIR